MGGKTFVLRRRIRETACPLRRLRRQIGRPLQPEPDVDPENVNIGLKKGIPTVAPKDSRKRSAPISASRSTHTAGRHLPIMNGLNKAPGPLPSLAGHRHERRDTSSPRIRRNALCRFRARNHQLHRYACHRKQ